MLSEEQQKTLASYVNALIDIPLIPEGIEQSIFEHAISLIDETLDAILPDTIKDLINNAQNGINRDHAEAFATRLKTYLNARLNIPYLNEDQEATIIGAVVDILVKGMTKGRDLESLLVVDKG